MKGSTLMALRALLESDETVSTTQREKVLKIFSDGEDPSTSAREVEARPGYLRKQQAATYLSIAPRTLTDWMNAGVVPYIKVGHTPLFRPRDLDKALDRFRREAIGER